MEKVSHSSHAASPTRPQEAADAPESLAEAQGSADAQIAKIAFINGYALFGDSTPTPRAGTALRAAQALLAERQDVSTLSFIEAQGTLEGLYGNIYQRRDRLWMKYDKSIRKWTARLSLDIPTDSLVAEILNKTSLAVAEATQAQRKDLKEIAAAVIAATIARYSDLVTELRALVAAAIAEGTALGSTAAAAMMAFHAGAPIPDMDALQRSTLKQLQQSVEYWRNVANIIQDMISGLAGDIAIGLPPMIEAGATTEQIHAYITKAIAIGAGAAFYLDSYIHAAFTLATLDAISKAGNLVDFITTGDQRVCPACFAAEDGNPYKAADVPPIPLHGGCRCWYGPAA